MSSTIRALSRRTAAARARSVPLISFCLCVWTRPPERGGAGGGACGEGPPTDTRSFCTQTYLILSVRFFFFFLVVVFKCEPPPFPTTHRGRASHHRSWPSGGSFPFLWAPGAALFPPPPPPKCPPPLGVAADSPSLGSPGTGGGGGGTGDPLSLSPTLGGPSRATCQGVRWGWGGEGGCARPAPPALGGSW